MNILSSCAKRSVSTLFNRYFYTSSFLNQHNQIEAGNQFCLEPLEYESHTLRKHDNYQRQRLYEFGLYVAACMPKYVQKVQMQHNDELEILVAPEGMFPVLSFMCHHQHACFNACSAATAIDVPSREYRFEVIYCILSLRFGQRARVKTYTDELTPLHSANSIWRVCNHFEREIYDMFGIVFTHHPDLRRILTDYGFTGHPLRKDFPLVGYTEVRYDDELKKIVYEPVEFAQEYRSYKLESPWNYSANFHEGYNNPLPEKGKK
ncbi:NADH dehydrogenase [ubiquinone] iron-sulfur protein 3, mitochondrial [Aphomia sociella]